MKPMLLSCTLVVQPLAWLLSMNTTEWTLCCETLIVFTFPILVFLLLLFVAIKPLTMIGNEQFQSLPCSKCSLCSPETILLFLDLDLKLIVDNLLISIATFPLQAAFCVILLVLLWSFLSNSTQLWSVDSVRLSRVSNQFSVIKIDCESLVSTIPGFLICFGGIQSQILIFAAEKIFTWNFWV